jgi:hypothetical protein
LPSCSRHSQPRRDRGDRVRGRNPVSPRFARGLRTRRARAPDSCSRQYVARPVRDRLRNPRQSPALRARHVRPRGPTFGEERDRRPGWSHENRSAIGVEPGQRSAEAPSRQGRPQGPTAPLPRGSPQTPAGHRRLSRRPSIRRGRRPIGGKTATRCRRASGRPGSHRVGLR